MLGTGAAEVEKRGRERWKRRIEETQISDRTLSICGAAILLSVLTGWAAWILN